MIYDCNPKSNREAGYNGDKLIMILSSKILGFMSKRKKYILSFTYCTIGDPLEIVKQRIYLSIHEYIDILEIRIQRRLKFFSYTYRVIDRTGKDRPIVRWDNYNGQIHYDSYDSNQRLFVQKSCRYKQPREIVQLVKIFRHNLANMEIDQLI